LCKRRDDQQRVASVMSYGIPRLVLAGSCCLSSIVLSFLATKTISIVFRTQNSFRGYGLFPVICSLKDIFCLGVIYLSCLVCELQKSSYRDSNPGQLFFLPGIWSLSLQFRQNKQLWSCSVFPPFLVSKLQKSPSVKLATRTVTLSAVVIRPGFKAQDSHVWDKLVFPVGFHYCKRTHIHKTSNICIQLRYIHCILRLKFVMWRSDLWHNVHTTFQEFSSSHSRGVKYV
jgi:hypothetical protein